MPTRPLIVAALVALSLLLFWRIEVLDRSLPHRLREGGWVLFMAPGGSPGGAQSTRQLRILNEATLSYLPSYTCGHATDVDPAREAHCPAVLPSWVNAWTGEVRAGVQSRPALHSMAAKSPARARSATRAASRQG